MKKAVAKFLGNNFIIILIYTSLLFMSVIGSTLALLIYSITVHIVTLMLVVGLYIPTFVFYKEFSVKQVLFRFVEASIILTTLIVLKHWYTFCISCFCIFLSFVYTFDARKRKL